MSRSPISLRGLDAWLTREPADDIEPPYCSIYDKPCLHDGEECDECCLREVMAAKDSDAATDRADWKAHQRRDQ